VSPPEGRSPWFYVAIGCGGILFLLAAALGTLFFVGFRAVKTLEEEQRDPEARRSKAERLLGVEELPRGYHSVVNFSLPFIFDMAILTDRPAGEDGDIDDQTEEMFIYVKVIRGGSKWSEFAAGEADVGELLEETGVDLDIDEVIAQSESLLVVGEMEIAYVISRGRVEVHDGQRMDGLTSVLFVRCSGDKKMRLGIWIGPDPDPHSPADEVDYGGTNADPEEIRDFMSNLGLCG
jgi:hypothetical protein